MITYIFPFDHAPDVLESVSHSILIVDVSLDLNEEIDIVHRLGIPGLDPQVTIVPLNFGDNLGNFVSSFTDISTLTIKNAAADSSAGGGSGAARIYIKRIAPPL